MSSPAHQVHSHQALKAFIEAEMHEFGPTCSLNHLDVSYISDFSNLFSDENTYSPTSRSNFIGDISDWNVSNATSMHRMFEGSQFNGDISNWKPVKVERMDFMFSHSIFNGDISRWKTPVLHDTQKMFQSSNFDGDLSDWIFSQVTTADRMFQHCPFSGDASRWDVARLLRIDCFDMFAPTFNGILPRVGNTPLERREFYRNMLNTPAHRRGLAQYLERKPFSSVHLDVALAAPAKPNGMSQVDFDWIKDIQIAGTALGFNDHQLLEYAMVKYHNRQADFSLATVDFEAQF